LIKELNIKNFAIIDSLNVKFNEGFNVITGETGAGKTLIIKAIDILLGGKINKKMIRNENIPLEINGKFIQHGEVLEVSRIFRNDRSYCEVNKKRISISDLLKKYQSLVQFQRQHDSNDLLDTNKHILILDSYIGIEPDVSIINNLFSKYLDDKKQYDDIKKNASALRDKIKLNKFQLDELNSVNLDIQEESLINKRYKQFVNSKDIIDTITKYIDLNDDFQISPIINVQNNIKSLSKYQSADADIDDLVQRLEEVLIELKDIKDDISKLDTKYHYSEEEKNIIEDKVLLYEQIKRKYGGSIEAAIKFKKSLMSEFDGNFSYDDKVKKLKYQLDLSKKKYMDKAQEISAIRKEQALNMEQEINNYLTQVDMPNSKIKILLKSSERFRDDGIDVCEIYVITNKGEKFKPLHEIASGGEISRIMLSVSLVLSNMNPNNTLIFDEVDTGVSGATASSMGNLLKGLAATKQLVVVTHLPQIASKAKSHIYCYKSIESSKTNAKLTYLNDQSRQEEIARMLSGEKITQHSLKQAERFILDG
tara:strand:- start:40 stop:1647 length:1608 start_codon:yes stop_codon:yes gene_type:complete